MYSGQPFAILKFVEYRSHKLLAHQCKAGDCSKRGENYGSSFYFCWVLIRIFSMLSQTKLFCQILLKWQFCFFASCIMIFRAIRVTTKDKNKFAKVTKIRTKKFLRENKHPGPQSKFFYMSQKLDRVTILHSTKYNQSYSCTELFQFSLVILSNFVTNQNFTKKGTFNKCIFISKEGYVAKIYIYISISPVFTVGHILSTVTVPSNNLSREGTEKYNILVGY